MQQTQLARKGEGVYFSGKKDVYERYLLLLDLANRSVRRFATDRPRWVYCTFMLQYLTAWADSCCLSLHEAMREPNSGIGDKVGTPTSFAFIY